MKADKAGVALVLLAIACAGCIDVPTLEVRNSTYDQSPASKFAWGAWSFSPDVVSQSAVSWFSERCGTVSEPANICAERLGMKCSPGPDLNCTYAAEEDMRRTDPNGPPGSREWRVSKFSFSITGDREGKNISASAHYGD